MPYVDDDSSAAVVEEDEIPKKSSILGSSIFQRNEKEKRARTEQGEQVRRDKKARPHHLSVGRRQTPGGSAQTGNRKATSTIWVRGGDDDDSRQCRGGRVVSYVPIVHQEGHWRLYVKFD